jgi:FKBP-type peptidyl-prolyl cis-trans isomerase FklB
MKKNMLWVFGLMGGLSMGFAACDETSSEVDPYDNWESRNQAYIDSIAAVAKANLGDEVGQWKMIHSYKFAEPLAGGSVNDYVYCQIAEKGEGTVAPLFTDSVDVHYRGKLIPLTTGTTVTFDQSFTGDLDPLRAGPRPCSRCMPATAGRSTSPPTWAMAPRVAPASPLVLRSFST